MRAAAVELDFWTFVERLHWGARSDGAFRHYANFLAWTDTTAIGINRAIQRSGDQALIARWSDLGDEPIRKQFRKLRNQALKDRRDVAPWRARVQGDIVTLFRSFDGSWPDEVVGRSTDYLLWLRDAAFPLLLEAISRGARGDTLLDSEFPLADQMAFPHTDPWTTASDPEFAILMGLERNGDS